MRLFKLIVSLVILGLIVAVVFQNMLTWTQPLNFKLSLHFKEFSGALKLYVVMLLSALIGFIIGLAVLLKFHFKTRRQLKKERRERKQAQEEVTVKQSRPEPQSEPAASSGYMDQGAGSEKE